MLMKLLLRPLAFDANLLESSAWECYWI